MKIKCVLSSYVGGLLLLLMGFLWAPSSALAHKNVPHYTPKQATMIVWAVGNVVMPQIGLSVKKVECFGSAALRPKQHKKKGENRYNLFYCFTTLARLTDGKTHTGAAFFDIVAPYSFVVLAPRTIYASPPRLW